MQLISYIVVVLIFMGPCVLAYLGWQVEGKNVSFVTSFYPSFYILFIFHIYFLLNSKKYGQMNKETTCLLIICSLYYFITYILNRNPSRMVLFNSILLPALYASFFNYRSINKNLSKIRNLIILLYIINSILSIIERLTLQNFFPLQLAYKNSDFTIENELYANLFRSTALLGHPLSNALITSIIMGFILISNFKNSYKYILYILGIIALLCFNARGAMLLSGLFFAIYIFSNLMRKNVTLSSKLYLSLIVICCIIIVAIFFEKGYGGRFFENDDVYSDVSIMTRIYVWSIFPNLSLSSLIFGVNGNEITYLAIKILGIVHIENWLILLILNIGILMTIFVLLLFIPIFKKSLYSFSNIQKFLLLGICLGIASTNNSLACGVPAISLFLVSSYAFSSKHLNIQH